MMIANVSLVLLLAASVAATANFTVRNNSPDQDLLLFITGTVNTPPYPLKAGEKVVLMILTDSWNGRISGRIDCLTTEDCAKFIPASLAEILLTPEGVYYDISLIDGFNIKTTIEPVDGEGDGDRVCEKTECTYPILEECPEELQVKNSTGSVVACEETKTDEAYAWFKAKCPLALTFVNGGLDDSYFCDKTELVITFL